MIPPPSGGCHEPVLSLPLPQANFIWRCAWFSVPSAIYAASASATASAATTHLAVVPPAYSRLRFSTGATPSAIHGVEPWIWLSCFPA